MTTYKLSPSAEYCVERMHLPTAQTAEVKKCIERYSAPTSFSGSLAWLVHQVLNFIKGFFGVSDKQMCLKLIRQQAVDLAIQQGLIQKDPHDKVQKFLKKRVQTTALTLAQALLNSSIVCNEQGGELTSDMRQRLDQLDLLKGVDKMRDIVNQIIHRRQAA